MKSLRLMISIAAALAAACILSSCNERRSYAELLNDENKWVNAFLADQKVIGYEDRDSTFQFECGEDAPYYQLDLEGNLYMQVLEPGTPGNRATNGQLIYFRFTRYNLGKYTSDFGMIDGEGNDSNMGSSAASFRYQSFTDGTTYQWGRGIQTPLLFLPLGCHVNLIIKSQFGLNSEIANVVPYLYDIRYFPSQI